jgi:hypothetical protein
MTPPSRAARSLLSHLIALLSGESRWWDEPKGRWEK